MSEDKYIVIPSRLKRKREEDKKEPEFKWIQTPLITQPQPLFRDKPKPKPKPRITPTRHTGVVIPSSSADARVPSSYTHKPYFSVRDKCFKVANIKLKGIRPLLQEWFWPDEDKRKVSGGCWNGQEIGRRVDREVSNWAKYPSSDRTSETLLSSRVHPYTKKLIRAFVLWKWTPVTSQLIVASKKLGGIATAIDLVFRDDLGRLIFVELKSGFDGYFEESHGSFSFPFQDVSNTPLHQAMAQLLFGYLLYKESGQDLPALAYVVNVNKGEVSRYLIDQAWGPRFLSYLPERCNHAIVNRGDSARPEPKTIFTIKRSVNRPCRRKVLNVVKRKSNRKKKK
jgi:hypothetical protein